MKKHWNITVQGRVQGVWYRASTQEKAHELGLTGFVQNQPDGSVYIEAEGTGEVLEAFLSWCHRGPLLARVDQVLVQEGEVQGYREFEQRR
ncbi:acylphosphatase [Telluribacter sp.]|jgi:acylphosphatase|uniref:acylphosphatase n=1 Tax=Telluribacter sp. TaxID=1978767 RepID=UPI002E161F38|nr:acylphosphatase [Telluribacter sp.]